jgi:hypothetical protein
MAHGKKGKKGAAKNKAKAPTVNIPWDQEVQGEGGNWVRVKEGSSYPFEVLSIKKDESSKGNPMLVIDFEGTQGKVKGKKTRDRFTILPQSLFKLRQMLEAGGQKVPSKAAKLDTSKIIGLEVGIEFEDHEYNDKMYSRPSNYMSPDDCDMGGKKKKGKKKGKKAKDDLEELDLGAM